MRIKILGVLLSLSLLLTFTMPATAFVDADQSAGFQPMYTNISSLVAGLSINSSGLAICNCRIIPSSETVTSVLITELQQYQNGAWSTISSWTYQAAGFQGASCTDRQYVSKGYQYRVYVTGKVFSSTGALLESQSKVSQAVFY